MWNDNREKSFMAGFFAGALLGTMGALLLAPMSGKRLRRDLSRESRRLAHRVAETAEDIRDQSTDLYESASEAVTSRARGLKEAAVALTR